MEQVFQLVNKILGRDRETKRRKLLIRTYKVIPLATQAGMIEFVSNTMSLGDWLPAAHKRYYPNDWTRTKISLDIKTAQSKAKAPGVTPTQRTKILVDNYTSICKHARPVMRHFFRERHKEPMAWFSMRLNYSRTAATSSIVGHVLGLGDRHMSNILIDRTTGDLVHIDLGIAFEQGKVLPIPENVPFRFTPDIVDGLGTTGPEGVFRRCSEETLRVLRDGSEVIKLILEVFKHDPLHAWTASASKLKRVQDLTTGSTTINSDRFGIGIGIDSDAASEAADRALSSVARKLDKKLSVEYTVNELITSAMDFLNLGSIFHGWNPQW